VSTGLRGNRTATSTNIRSFVYPEFSYAIDDICESTCLYFPTFSSSMEPFPEFC
jgi:hypothetical protein